MSASPQQKVLVPLVTLLAQIMLSQSGVIGAPTKQPISAGLINTGRKMVHSGKFHQAMPLFQRAVEGDPNNPDGYLERGALYYRFDKMDEALKDFDMCISLKGDTMQANKLKAKIYYERKQSARAMECVSDALKTAPTAIDKAECYHMRGKLYCDLKQYDKALADFNSALALQSKGTTTYKHRGNLYMSLKKYDKAIADYTKALEFESTDRDLVHSLRAQAYDKIGRKDLAAEDRKKTNSSVMNEFSDFMGAAK